MKMTKKEERSIKTIWETIHPRESENAENRDAEAFSGSPERTKSHHITEI
jgi:hypothetical protein